MFNVNSLFVDHKEARKTPIMSWLTLIYGDLARSTITFPPLLEMLLSGERQDRLSTECTAASYDPLRHSHTVNVRIRYGVGAGAKELITAAVSGVPGRHDQRDANAQDLIGAVVWACFRATARIYWVKDSLRTSLTSLEEFKKLNAQLCHGWFVGVHQELKETVAIKVEGFIIQLEKA